MRRLPQDPRYSQIAFLLALLFFGVWARDFGVNGTKAIIVLGTAFLCQSFAILLLGQPVTSLLSAAISGTSLLLLCRSNSLTLLALAAALSIFSKFLFRLRGKHFFNPTCFGIVTLLLSGASVWVSPGQWGQETLVAFWILALGVTVVRRSGRVDISLAFLGTYLLLLLLRILYLGQPLSLFWHQWQNGGLLLFTFFMISDPRSTPDHRVGRFLFAALVALGAYYLRFFRYQPNALLLALFFLSPATLILDTLFKHSRFQWISGRLPYATPRSDFSFVGLLHQLDPRAGLLRFLRGEGGREPL